MTFSMLYVFLQSSEECPIGGKEIHASDLFADFQSVKLGVGNSEIL
jgi:hypothetical protein